MKYAVNRRYGGFILSKEAIEWLVNEKHWHINRHRVNENDIVYCIENENTLEFRSDPELIECIETLGDRANGEYAKIEIINCPYSPDENIEIEEWGGVETIQTIPDRW